MFKENEKEDNVVKIEDRRKVSLRFNAIRIIDTITDLMYCDAVKLQMQKMGYSVEPEDIDKAKKASKKSLIDRHLAGKSTKQLSGAISALKDIAANLKKDMTALTLNMPEVKNGNTRSEIRTTDERVIGKDEGDSRESDRADY